MIKEISRRPPVYLIGSNYRVTLFSSSLIRAEYSTSGVFDEENPIILEPNFSVEVPHDIKNNNPFQIKTTHFEFSLVPDGRAFDIGNLSFRIFNSLNGEYIWEPGIIDEENIGGAMLDLYKFPHGKTAENFTDGLISKNGLFVYRNHCEFLWDKKTKWVKKRSDWNFQDWYLFGYGMDYKNALGDFVNLFGKIPLVPRWVFGYWYSRWYKFSDKEILSVIDKLKENGIPLDVFVIDTDWRKHVWNGYEWNSKFFPEPSKFIRKLKDMRLKCCLNDHPGYGISDVLPHDDPFKEKIKNRTPDINEFRIKWNDDRYVNAWIDEIFKKFLDDGIDFWWVDGWGATDGIMDLNSQLWLNRFYFEAAKRTSDDRRPLILSRWGGVGSHKFPLQFSGDTYSNFETLKYEISFTHKGGNVGASYWSHDIGGFLGEVIPEELFIRWVQFGCFSPVLRTHSSGASRDIWNYSQRAIEIFRKYVKIRYALNPYFYKLARDCHDFGIPLIRGLYIEYPQDENAYKYDEEYLIGDSLLIAPAHGPGEVFESEVYFPKGEWISLETNEVVNGPVVKKIKIPLEIIPVYIKKASIIPAVTVGESLSEEIKNIELNIFPDKDSGFVYYEDDGHTEEYLRNKYLTRKILARKTDNMLQIKIEKAEGNYPNASQRQNVTINIFAVDLKPKKLSINGTNQEVRYTNKIFSGCVESKFQFITISQEISPTDEVVLEIEICGD